MAEWKDDIEKYRSGKLTPAEMHALEKKALNDPFLADALEGVESISTDDFSRDVLDLDKRLSSKTRKAGWFTPLRIAAGMVILIGSIFLIYNINQHDEQLALQNEESPSPTTGGTADSTTNNNNQPELLSLNQATEDKTKTSDKPGDASGITTKSAEESGEQKPAAGISSSPVTEPNPSEEAVKAEQTEAAELAEITRDAKAEEKEDIAVAPAQQAFKKEALDKDIVSGAKARKSAVADDAKMRDEERSQQTVSGQVTSSEDGLPLPGVNVTVKGTTNKTVTDMQGNYSINVGDEKQKLVFSYIGLQTSEISADDKSISNVKLKDDMSQLSEVVVTELAFANDRDQNEPPVIKLAEPIGGRKAYNEYLEKSLRYPQEALDKEIKGKVTIEFAVRPDGSITNFKIIKSLGYGCDEELVRLVKEGPKWSPSTEGNVAIESKVRVKLKFDPSKVKK